MKRLLCGLVLAACSGAPKTSTPVASTVTARATELEAELVELRRDLHAHPEISGEERRTSAVIAARLRSAGLEVTSDVGGHGLVAMLRGAEPGRTIAYRAELDAMPGSEPAGRPYGSVYPDAYHVCGHDLHMAIAVGVASSLASVRSQLRGNVMFIFQPAEETWQGADAMLAAGLFRDDRPDEIFALHSFPFEVGTMARDVAFAGLDRFRVELLGENASEEVAERISAQLSQFGNVKPPRSPGQVEQYLTDLQRADGPLAQALYVDIERDEETPFLIEGVFKSHSDSRYPELRNDVNALLRAELGPSGYSLQYPNDPLPSMVSDARLSDEASAALLESLSTDQLLTLRAQHAFSGEDFARFLQRVPGAMFLLGVGNRQRGILGAPHFPDFDADEGAILVGTRAMSVLMLRRLEAE